MDAVAVIANTAGVGLHETSWGGFPVSADRPGGRGEKVRGGQKGHKTRRHSAPSRSRVQWPGMSTHLRLKALGTRSPRHPEAFSETPPPLSLLLSCWRLPKHLRRRRRHGSGTWTGADPSAGERNGICRLHTHTGPGRVLRNCQLLLIPRHHLLLLRLLRLQ